VILQEDQNLHREVERLRELLRRHGIEPDGGRDHPDRLNPPSTPVDRIGGSGPWSGGRRPAAGLQQRPGPNNGSVHRIIGPVAALHFLDALGQGHGLAGRCHVGDGERIHDWPVLDRKGGQLADQAALLGLKTCAGVVGDQSSQPLLTLGAKEPGAVHGMEAEPIQRRRLAHVIHQRGCDQQVGILSRQRRGHARRLVGNYLHVHPPVAQGCDQPCCLHRCPRFQGHGATIPCALDRAQAAVLAA
jgi:hypothetical protein